LSDRVFEGQAHIGRREHLSQYVQTEQVLDVPAVWLGPPANRRPRRAVKIRDSIVVPLLTSQIEKVSCGRQTPP
jgi:hypothetical protein